MSFFKIIFGIDMVMSFPMFVSCFICSYKIHLIKSLPVLFCTNLFLFTGY
ncbi:hypothetical protein MtrunA17_Chr7g0245661 [Medicago truncatula]|uniref:Uncharacterized protein n=1 Tax=Medicago truncatula TaxID=3880 RepID=A2Q3X2_MEDTR|nr:hypothetical protein MtrDRAFT_AC155890g31v2 [Medicago truncatula]RHN46760.1 hypothetical protein MtrunA17_Chr7g0245661 [Medicago truncatula]